MVYRDLTASYWFWLPVSFLGQVGPQEGHQEVHLAQRDTLHAHQGIRGLNMEEDVGQDHQGKVGLALHFLGLGSELTVPCLVT